MLKKSEETMVIDRNELISYEELKPGSLIECYYLERDQKQYPNRKKIHVEQTRDFFYNDVHDSNYLTDYEGNFPIYLFLKSDYWKGAIHLAVYSLSHKTIGWIPVRDTLIKPVR